MVGLPAVCGDPGDHVDVIKGKSGDCFQVICMAIMVLMFAGPVLMFAGIVFLVLSFGDFRSEDIVAFNDAVDKWEDGLSDWAAAGFTVLNASGGSEMEVFGNYRKEPGVNHLYDIKYDKTENGDKEPVVEYKPLLHNLTSNALAPPYPMESLFFDTALKLDLPLRVTHKNTEKEMEWSVEPFRADGGKSTNIRWDSTTNVKREKLARVCWKVDKDDYTTLDDSGGGVGCYAHVHDELNPTSPPADGLYYEECKNIECETNVTVDFSKLDIFLRVSNDPYLYMLKTGDCGPGYDVDYDEKEDKKKKMSKMEREEVTACSFGYTKREFFTSGLSLFLLGIALSTVVYGGLYFVLFHSRGGGSRSSSGGRHKHKGKGKSKHKSKGKDKKKSKKSKRRRRYSYSSDYSYTYSPAPKKSSRRGGSSKKAAVSSSEYSPTSYSYTYYTDEDKKGGALDLNSESYTPSSSLESIDVVTSASGESTE